MVIRHADHGGHLHYGHQHHNHTRRLVARVVQHPHQRYPHHAQKRQKPERATRNRKAKAPQLTGILLCRRWMLVAVKRNQNPPRHGPRQQNGERGEKPADVVDAQISLAEISTENRLIALRQQKAAGGGQENPLAEMNEVPARLGIPMKAVGTTGQPQVHDDKLGNRPDNSAKHQRPDRLQRHGQCNHRQQADDLSGKVQKCHPPQQQMSVGRIDPCRIEPRDQQRQPRRGQKLQQLWRIIKLGGRPSQGTGQKPQHPAAQNIQRKGGVEKGRIIPLAVLADRGANPHVGKHRQAHQHDRHQRHHAKGFGEQKPCQNEVRDQPQPLRHGVRSRRQHRPGQGALEQAGRRIGRGGQHFGEAYPRKRHEQKRERHRTFPMRLDCTMAHLLRVFCGEKADSLAKWP